MASKVVLAAVLLAGMVVASDAGRAQPDGIERGRALVTQLCGACHAVGKSGASAHAGAPAFRSLGDRIELDTFPDRLREGLQSTHADMPSFRFSRDDARAVLAYLRSIQIP
jgi:mono/diheme cytochrome c family protein